MLLEALAEKEGIDVDRLYAEAAIEEAEPSGSEAGAGSGESLVGEAETDGSGSS